MSESSNSKPNRHHSLLKSFSYAWKGIGVLLSTQRNARIHLLASAVVILVGIRCELPSAHWALVFLAMGLVWLAEGMNTALEFLTDLASPDHHPLAGKTKDVAAGAVLLAACFAFGVGVSVFLPYVLRPIQ